MSSNRKYTYIDLFAGCGGLSLGLHNAGWKGVFAIEKSPDAFLTLEHNLIKKKNHFEWPDWLPQSNLEINEVIEKYSDQLQQLEGTIDMVAGGPPCQGFSMAGRRKENDSRNNLVESYIKFIKLVKPNVLFFENVKGFTLGFKKNKEKGKAYSEYVVNELEAAGYHVKGQLIDFGTFGIPQKRTRFILVGVKKEIALAGEDSAKLFFDQIEANKKQFLINKKISVNTSLGDAISDLLKQNGTDESETKHFQAGLYTKPLNAYQRLMREGVNNRIADSHRFSNHRIHIIEKFDYILKHSRRNQDIGKEIRDKLQIKKHTVIPLDKKEKSPTITTLPDDYVHYSEPRILTVREYARIQSFPDWYEFKGKYTTGGDRRTKEVPRYTQIGNAIPPLFGEQSGNVLKKLII